MKRERDVDTDYEVDRWTVKWCLQYDRIMVLTMCLQYDRIMVRVNAAHGDPQQMHILEQEAEALTQAGRDWFAA